MGRRRKKREPGRRKLRKSSFYVLISAGIELSRKHAGGLISSLMKMKILIGTFIGLIQGCSLKEYKK